MDENVNTLEHFHIYKSNSFKATKKNKAYPVSLCNLVDEYSPKDVMMGNQGVYIKPYLAQAHGRIKYPILMLDIEDTEISGHADIQKNIDAAYSAMNFLHEHNLLSGLKIILSGNGFRFVWPYILPKEYLKAWKEFILEHAFIDNKSYSETHQRLLAYRNTYLQDKEPKDIHTHVLSSYQQLKELTPDIYKKMVSGTLSEQQFKAWLPQLIPKEFAPSTWLEMLDFYQLKSKFKAGIIRVPQILNKAVNSNQILKYLDDMKITYNLINTQHGDIYQLSKCPICKDKRKNLAYVTMSGRIKCWTTRCQAGDRDNNDNIIGLSPDKWIDGYVQVQKAPEKQIYTDIETARQEIEKIAGMAGNHIIKATPGIGKTTSYLKGLGKVCLKKPVVYAVPTKEKAEEIAYSDAKIIKEKINISVIEGRNQFNCKKEKLPYIQKTIDLGLRPMTVICMSCPIYINNKCKYLKQFEALKKNEPGLYVTSHMLARFRDNSDWDTLIFDEDPTQSMLEPVKLKLEDILFFQESKTNKIFDKIATFKSRIIGILKENNARFAAYFNQEHEKYQLIKDVIGITEDEYKALDNSLDKYKQQDDEKYAEYQNRLYAKEVNLNSLNFLLSLIGVKNTLIAVKGYNTEKRKFVEFLIFPKKRIKAETLTVLDATGKLSALKSLFNRDFKYHEFQADVSTGNKFYHFQQNVCKKTLKKFTDKQITGLLKKCSQHVKAGDKVLICAYKKHLENIAKIATKTFPKCTVGGVHYGANRGLNGYKDFNVCIMFGLCRADQLSLWQTATSLYDKQTDIAQHIHDLVINENYQTVHRIRLINKNKTVIVIDNDYELSGLPNANEKSQLSRGNEYCKNNSKPILEASLNRLQAFINVFGVMDKHLAWACGVWCERDAKNAKQYQEIWFNLLRSSYETVFEEMSESFLYYTIIGKTQLKMQKQSHNYSNNKYWDKLFKSLQENNTDLPLYETKQTWNKSTLTGIGKLEDAEKLVNFCKGEFKPELWKQL